jgi:hypothetical protein
MPLHKITEFYTEWFSVYPNITSKFRTIAIFKNCVKQNNDSNKRIVGYFTILNFNCVGKSADSSISGSLNFIIFHSFTAKVK